MTTVYAYEDGDILTWGDLRRDYVEFVTWATFLSFQAGLWVWEYGNTFSLDWALIRRKYHIRPSGICFVMARFALMGHYICQIFFVQSAIQVNCQTLWICNVLLGTVALNCSNAIFCLRACAVWKYRAAVIIPLAVLWLLQLALWMLDVISIQIQPALLPAMGHTCTAHDKVFMGGIPFVLTILVDLTASTLIATRLFNRGGEKSKAKKIRRMLLKDALSYSIVTLPMNIAAPILFWMSKDLPMQTLLLTFALLIHVLLSSRAFIKLHNLGSFFRQEIRTVARNGEHLHPLALERLFINEMTISSPQNQQVYTKGHDDSDRHNSYRAHDDPENSSVHLKAQREVRSIYKQHNGGSQYPAMPAALSRRRNSDETTDDGFDALTRVNSPDLERCLPLQEMRRTLVQPQQGDALKKLQESQWVYVDDRPHLQPQPIRAVAGAAADNGLRGQGHVPYSMQTSYGGRESDETLRSQTEIHDGHDLRACQPRSVDEVGHADITQSNWHTPTRARDALPHPLSVLQEDIGDGPTPTSAHLPTQGTDDPHRKPIYRQMTMNKLMGDNHSITVANVSTDYAEPPSRNHHQSPAADLETLDRHIMAANYGRCRRTRHTAAASQQGRDSPNSDSRRAGAESTMAESPDALADGSVSNDQQNKQHHNRLIGGHALGFHWRYPHSSSSSPSSLRGNAVRVVPSPSRSAARRPLHTKPPSPQAQLQSNSDHQPSTGLPTPTSSGGTLSATTTARFHPLSRNRSDSPTLGSLDSVPVPAAHLGVRGGSGSVSRARRDRERALEGAKRHQRITERAV